MRRALDALGVREPAPKRASAPPTPPADNWYKEGRECPF